ncbi:hypothetical protein HR060_01260 [Catenovulum sp. SM1970]|uniref:hypothetical protein n=1 Tax=Marinifaba aquimaris TaxID=2741323 RepID=UPI001573DE4E|nr:hypothetical protein [Marinifaba aquimaris]NTS75480.1 hypothetical protein [Marinifaba aquimaris]
MSETGKQLNLGQLSNRLASFAQQNKESMPLRELKVALEELQADIDKVKTAVERGELGQAVFINK